MRLFNVKTVKKVIIFGTFDCSCFSIDCTPVEFEELKKTGILIDDISVYDSFISITCSVNSEGSQDLISKAASMGIQTTYYV